MPNNTAGNREYHTNMPSESQPLRYDSFSNGQALVEKDGKLMYIDHSGAVVWEER